LPYREGVRYVCVTPTGGELDLRSRVAPTQQCIDHRKAQMARYLTSLIEPTLIFAAPVQRYRNDAVCVFQDCRSA